MCTSTYLRTGTALCAVFFMLSLPLLSQAFMDTRSTTKSALELSVNNAGALGYDTKNFSGGLLYPRGNANRHQYLLGSGLWFGAKKKQDNGSYTAMTVFGYDPNTSGSRFTPGNLYYGDSVYSIYENEYGMYVSSDYDMNGSAPKAARWAMWDNNSSQILGMNRYWGNFIQDSSLRNRTANNRPAYISDEDLVTVYKDTDLRYYDIGKENAKALGYPLRLEVLQRVFTWQSGELANTAIVVWELKNLSNDTLRDCWFGYMADPDISALPVTTEGTANDFASFIELPGTHGLQYAWTNTDAGEDPVSAAVIGISFLETPAADAQGFGRIGNTIAAQIGTATSSISTIANAPMDDASRYAYLSTGQKDIGLKGATDIRTLNATGPFHIVPGQMLRFAACITVGGLSAKAETQDSASVIDVVKNLRAAIKHYYNNLLATDVKEEHTKNTALISPNPASDGITLQMDSTDDETLSIQIYNELGQRVYSSEYSPQNNNSNLRIDCSTFATGSYTLHCTSTTRNTTQQFVIMR